MKTSFFILLSQKNHEVFTGFGEFWLGSDATEASEVFGLLEGSNELEDQALIHFDLVETVDGLPIKINITCCTLDQYARNCKTIVKEIFKRFNFKGGIPGLK